MALLQVVLAAVIRTVLANSPLIFLRTAEIAEGQNDAIMAADPYDLNFAVNYTGVWGARSAPAPRSLLLDMCCGWRMLCMRECVRDVCVNLQRWMHWPELLASR